MHHQRNRLHLDRRWRFQARFLQVPENLRVEPVLRLQILKRAHRVGNVGAVHVDTVLIANAVDLKLMIQKNKKGKRVRITRHPTGKPLEKTS